MFMAPVRNCEASYAGAKCVEHSAPTELREPRSRVPIDVPLLAELNAPIDSIIENLSTRVLDSPRYSTSTATNR